MHKDRRFTVFGAINAELELPPIAQRDSFGPGHAALGPARLAVGRGQQWRRPTEAEAEQLEQQQRHNGHRQDYHHGNDQQHRKRSDKPRARPRGRPRPTGNGDVVDAGHSSMGPCRVPLPLRAARQGTQDSGAKLLSRPQRLIESRFMLRCRPLGY